MCGWIEDAGSSNLTHDRNEGSPFSEDYVPDEDNINAVDPFNNMDSDGEEFIIDIETV